VGFDPTVTAVARWAARNIFFNLKIARARNESLNFCRWRNNLRVYYIQNVSSTNAFEGTCLEKWSFQEKKGLFPRMLGKLFSLSNAGPFSSRF
jgi:hypothetical protein